MGRSVRRRQQCAVVPHAPPDAPVPAGSSAEVFRFLGLDADGIFETARRALEE